MKYLDSSIMPDFLANYFSAPAMIESRRVGRNRECVSEYFEIIRFFGEAAIDPKAVAIRYLDGKYQLRDPLIREFSHQVESRLRAEGRLYEGPTVMRLQDFDRGGTQPLMTVQEADYGDQAAGFALDLPHPLFDRWGGTCRQYYKSVYPSTKLEENPLCVCLGVCGYLLLKEGDRRFLLQVRRSARLASLESSLGPSVAGAVDYSANAGTLADLISSALGKEVEEELSLQAEEYDIVPLAYAREIYRGERPQLFCMITCALSRATVAARLESIEIGEREFDSFDFIAIDGEGGISANLYAELNYEAKMNLYLLQECCPLAG
jgi:hypothetical protein